METITATGEIDRLFNDGQRAGHAHVLLIAIRTPEARGHDGRVLFVAGKRLGNAVMRNRSKRVLRAAVRRAGGPWPGWDVALVSRSATATAPAADLDRAVRRAVDALGIAR